MAASLASHSPTTPDRHPSSDGAGRTESDETLETGERLAAYAAGELDVDETRALEAELARDPALRARLAAIRETDELLASLPDVAPREGFSARLRDAVASELDTTLGGSGMTDELGARRETRRHRMAGRWPVIAAAAASVLVIGGVGTFIAQGGLGGADQDVAGGSDGDSDSESASSLDAMAAPAPESGPTVVSAGRSFDADSIGGLAADARFDEVLSQRLDQAEAAQLARDSETALTGEGANQADGAAESGPVEQSQQESTIAQAPALDDPSFGLRTVGAVTERELEDVGRCLPPLLEAAPVIPVYAELVDFDGADAIVYGLVGNDPEQDRYRRVELWVVDRADCQVLHLEQVDR